MLDEWAKLEEKFNFFIYFYTHFHKKKRGKSLSTYPHIILLSVLLVNTHNHSLCRRRIWITHVTYRKLLSDDKKRIYNIDIDVYICICMYIHNIHSKIHERRNNPHRINFITKGEGIKRSMIPL